MLKYRCACSTLACRRVFDSLLSALHIFYWLSTWQTVIRHCVKCACIHGYVHTWIRVSREWTMNTAIDYELRQVECYSHPIFGERISTSARHSWWSMMFARTSTAVIYVTRSSNPIRAAILYGIFLHASKAGTNMSNPRLSLPINSRYIQLVTYVFFFYYFSSIWYLRCSIFLSSCSRQNFRCVFNATIYLA